MDCLAFRRRVGAEPAAVDPALAAHRAACPACARHQDELLAMDGVLRRAMRIGIPEGSDPAWRERSPAGTAPGAKPASSTRRWLAMAASLVAGVLVAATLWVSYPSPTLASEVIDHAMHEPESWTRSEELSGERVRDALGPSGARLLGGAGPVTYARRCLFDGHWVPHLVVQTAEGPVTVFLLAHRRVGSATRVEGHGFTGVVLPARHGSIAVVGRDLRGLDAIARQVLQFVEWDA